MKAIVRSLAVEMALQQRATGRRIAQFRERARLTQEAAADKAGVTLRAYQKWEAGGGIQYANLQRLADALNTSVEEITGEIETPSPFRVSEQLDGVTEEFRRRVDHVEEHLEQIKTSIDEARRERETQASEVKRLLRQQSALLERIRKLVAQNEEIMQPDRLAQLVVETNARIPPSAPSTRS